MKKVFSILVLASTLFISCKKEETAEAPPTEETTDATAVTTDSLVPTEATAQVQPAANGNSGTILSQPSGGTTTTTAAAPIVTAPGMNPPHGQPGHRCEIAVGAPLSSAPKKTNINPAGTAKVTQATTVTPEMLKQAGAATPTQAPVTPVVTAPGMNPPHGQEGHVCGVPVGEPLPKKE